MGLLDGLAKGENEVNLRLDYEKQIFGSPGGKLISLLELAAIIQYLQPKKSEVILDIGTGTGRIARKIVTSSGASVIGVDINRHNLKIAQQRRKTLKEYADAYNLVAADGQYLPFKNSVFDSVVCIRVLKYFPNYELGVREISRVLKNNGKAVLSVSNIFSVDLFLLRFKMLAYSNLFNFRKMVQIFKKYALYISGYRGLHKIHPKIWTIFKNSHFLAFLYASELVFQKMTLKEVFSREILAKFIKISVI